MPAANSKKSAAAVTPVAFKKKIGTCLREYRKAVGFYPAGKKPAESRDAGRDLFRSRKLRF